MQVTEVSPTALQPDLSVVVCTFDRDDLVARLFEHLASMERPAATVELVLVNNNAPRELDASLVLAARALEQFVSVVVVDCSPPGLSRARNAGLASSRAQLVAFLDDDALPDATWFDEVVDAFDDHPRAGAIGGPVLPDWSGPRPNWLGKDLEGVLSVLEEVTEARSLPQGEYVVGANMAFRSALLRAAGGFPEHLGRVGSSLLGNEEQLPQDGLREAGWEVWLVPGPRVGHLIHADRLQKAWFLRRYAWQAASDVLGDQIDTCGAEMAGHRLLPHLDTTLGQLFTGSDDSDFGVAARAIRDLMTFALVSGETNDWPKLGKLTGQKGAPKTQPTVPMAPPPLRPSRELRVIFGEVTPGHEYLYEALESGDSQLVVQQFDPWRGADYAQRLADFFTRVTDASELVKGRACFLTIDYFARSEVVRLIPDDLRPGPRPTGFLHKFPETRDQRQGLVELASRIGTILVFSEDMAQRLRWEIGIADVQSVPHPQSHDFAHLEGRDEVRERLGIRGGSRVFSIVGEVRDGKNAYLALEAAAMLRENSKVDSHILFSGKCNDLDARILNSRVLELGMSATLDLRRSRERRDFALLTDFEYRQRILASDIGLLLYSGPQAMGMSGILPDYAKCGIPVVTLPGSLVASEVRRAGIGIVAASNSPWDVADAFGAALALAATDTFHGAAAEYSLASTWATSRARLRESFAISARSDSEGIDRVR